MRPTRRTVRAVDTEALVLRRVDYGDADLVLHLFTEANGRVAALARAARKSQKRFGGALEPFHTLRIRLEERDNQDLATLSEATIAVPRRRVVSHLDGMAAAGKVLGWIREAAPPRVREPDIWTLATRLLDEIEGSEHPGGHQEAVVKAGLRLLVACGWGLEFNQCVICGKPCDMGRAAFVDASRGGLVCRACGGASTQLSGAQRRRLGATAQGDDVPLPPIDVDVALDLVERALQTHVTPR